MTCNGCGIRLKGIEHWRLEVAGRKLIKGKTSDRGHTPNAVHRRLWGFTHPKTLTKAANPQWGHAGIVVLCDPCMDRLTEELNNYAPVVDIMPKQEGEGH